MRTRTRLQPPPAIHLRNLSLSLTFLVPTPIIDSPYLRCEKMEFFTKHLETLVSIIFGAAITWVFSYWYYVKSGKELKAEAKQLRHLNMMLLSGLENAELMKIRRDADGLPIGINVQGAAQVHGESLATATSK